MIVAVLEPLHLLCAYTVRCITYFPGTCVWGFRRLSGYLRAFMSFGEAFLQVSALTTTMPIPLELSIRKRPSEVKSMPNIDPSTFIYSEGARSKRELVGYRFGACILLMETVQSVKWVASYSPARAEREWFCPCK